MSEFGQFFKQSNLIGGKWTPVQESKSLAVTNPADGSHMGLIPNNGADETASAIAAAEQAFNSFKLTTANERANILRKMHDVMLENQQQLALILTTEQGKPLAEAMGEIAIGAAYLLWFAEEARRVYGSIMPSPWIGKQIQATKEPVGVVAVITPWNFPSSMLARKIGPAIAAGCTCVVKPSELTPYSALAWGVIGEKAGLPAGVINVVTGNAINIGGELTSNSTVRKITFTGSTAVGKILLKQAADTVKKVSMELGGNAPFIVFDDADIDRAIDGAMIAKYRNSGQTCVCTNRFYVQAGVYDTFVQKLAEAADNLKVGNGLEKGTEQGPLVMQASVEKVEDLIQDAKDNGARIVTGGARHELGGTFFQPTVIADVSQSMRVAAEEIFGPVSAVIKFETEREVVQLANDTEFGLASYFYTKDLGRAHRVIAALKYGLVGVNEGLITTVEAPFGGMKESGLGSEGGAQGINEYLDTKYACIGGLDA